MEPAEAAVNVFVCYRQLEELLKYLAPTSYGKPASEVSRVVRTSVPTHNAILKSLKECLAVNDAFAERITHLQPLDPEANNWDLLERLKSDGAVLRGTAHAFIELYLSPEEKKKAIGFQS